MMSLRRKHLMFLVIAGLPLLQNCGRARYEQVVVRKQHHIEEPTGPLHVEPAPPTGGQTPAPPPAPPPSQQPPPDGSTSQQVPVPVDPKNDPAPIATAPEPLENDEVPWMDPTRYNSAGQKNVPLPPPRTVPLPPPPGPVTPQVPVRECPMNCYVHTGSFSAGTETGKLDVLFVIDTRQALSGAESDAIEQMIQTLPSGLNLHVGVLATRRADASDVGRLVRVGVEPEVLDSTRMGSNEFRQSLREKLTRTKVDASTAGGTIGLAALDTALRDDGHMTAILNLGLFRANAAMAVVYISDELGQGNEARIHAKVRVRKPTAHDQDNGGRLITPALTVGVVARPEFRKELARVSDAIRRQFGSAPEFVIDRPGPVDENTICVLTGDNASDLREAKVQQFTPARNSVRFEPAEGASARVTMIYWCADREDTDPNKRPYTQEEKYRSIRIDPRCESLKRTLRGAGDGRNTP